MSFVGFHLYNLDRRTAMWLLCANFTLFIIIPVNSAFKWQKLWQGLHSVDTKYILFLLKLLHRAYNMLWHYYWRENEQKSLLTEVVICVY